MLPRKMSTIFFCCSALSSLPIPLQASIPGIYLLGQIGSGNTHISEQDAAALSVERADLSGRFAVGYQFNQNMAIELGYLQFSNARFYQVGGHVNKEVSLGEKAIDIAVKPMLALSTNLTFYGRLGLACLKANGEAFVNERHYLDYADSWDPVFGLGLSYDISPSLPIDLSWMRLQNLHGNDNKTPSADFYSIGFAYYFG